MRLNFILFFLIPFTLLAHDNRSNNNLYFSVGNSWSNSSVPSKNFEIVRLRGNIHCGTGIFYRHKIGYGITSIFDENYREYGTKLILPITPITRYYFGYIGIKGFSYFQANLKHQNNSKLDPNFRNGIGLITDIGNRSFLNFRITIQSGYTLSDTFMENKINWVHEIKFGINFAPEKKHKHKIQEE